MQALKSGAILSNAGHFNIEIDGKWLSDNADSVEERDGIQSYHLGKKVIHLLAEGRLVNLAAAEGHPAEVMDMSFANQALCVEHLANSEKKPPKVYSVPKEIDETIARLKLKAMKVEIDELTDEQKKYLATWEMGTT